MSHVKLSSLAVGQPFIASWREAGAQIGVLEHKGLGSCTVKIPLPDGTRLETTTWSPGTMVIPATREEFNAQRTGNTDRERSTADNPVQRVHEICAEMGGRATVGQVVERCVAEGINKNTAKTQYYAWRRQK